jgi:hypothetical protein
MVSTENPSAEPFLYNTGLEGLFEITILFSMNTLVLNISGNAA